MNGGANAIDNYVQCGPLHFGGILKNKIGIRKNGFTNSSSMKKDLIDVGTVSNFFEHLEQKTDEFKEREIDDSKSVNKQARGTKVPILLFVAYTTSKNWLFTQMSCLPQKN